MARTEQKRSEETLRGSEERFRTMFELSPEAIVLIDKSGKIITTNKKVHDWLGYEPEEIIGKRISKLPFFTKTSLFKVLRHFKQRMQGRDIPPYELEFLDKKGQKGYGRLTANPIRDERGEITSILVMISNITERKRAEEEVKASKDYIGRIMNGMYEELMVIDRNYKIKEVNQCFIEQYGGTRKDVIGHYCYEVTHQNPKPCRDLEHPCPLESVFKKGKSFHTEHVHTDHNGIEHIEEISGFPLFDSDGNVESMVEIFRDITERKQAEEALRNSEERYRNLVEGLHDVIYSLDITGAVTSINKASKALLGLEPEEILGKNITEFIPKETLQFVMEKLKQTGAGEAISSEAVMINKDGNQHNVEFSSTPVIQSGKVVGTRGIVRDITERKRAEEALAESEERFRTITASAHDAIIMINNDGYITYWNEAAERVFGYSKREALNNNVHLILAPERYHDAYRKGFSAFQETGEGSVIGKTIELEGIRKDGTELPVELSVSSVKVNGKWQAIGIVRDITERKLAEEALQESEEKFRLLFETAKDAIFWADTKTGLILRCNKAAELLLEKEREEIIGCHQSELHPPEKLEDYRELFKKHVTDKGELGIEMQVINKSGAIKDVSVTASVTIVGEQHIIQGIFHDITERKRAEEKIKANLREKEVLLKEIHHRVKNNLQVISSLLNLGARDIKDPQAQRVFTDSQNRIKSMAFIHEKLYRSKDLSRIDFSDYVRDLLDTLLVTYAKASRHVYPVLDLCELRLELDQAIPLALIINELISNALEHAFPDEREGRITVSLKQMGQKKCALSIADNGVGLPDGLDILDTKSLGLQLVHMLCDQLKAKLELVNHRGAEFRIEFPVITEGARS